MSTNTKPRICEVLGGKDNPFEVGEVFTVRLVSGFEISLQVNSADEVGHWDNPHRLAPMDVVCYAINYPESIIRKPRFTEDEVADARAIIRLIDGSTAGLLQRADTGALRIKMGETIGSATVQLDCTLFPSILPGQSVAIADIIGQKENRPG